MNDGERLAVLETQVNNIENEVSDVKSSVSSLHGKIDGLIVTLSSTYVTKEEFKQYNKSTLLERILTILLTAAITGLVAFFIAHK